MLAGLVFVFGSALAQEATPIPPSPFDRVLGLELGPGDPVLEGKGPSKRVEYEARFSGTLYVWTMGEGIDPFLRVEDASGAVLEEDDDGGGKPTPCVALEVEPGQALAVIVALKDRLDALRRLELHLVAAPESEATRAAAARGRALLEEARGLQPDGEQARVRKLLAQALAEVQATDGAEHSAEIADVLWTSGSLAGELGALDTAQSAWDAIRRYGERALPGSHDELLEARSRLAAAMAGMGDLRGARDLEERALEACQRTLPEEHPDLLAARMNLAEILYRMGDFSKARDLIEHVLPVYERTLPENHPNLLGVRLNLAATMKAMGDLRGARLLEEGVLAGFERTLPEDHPNLLMARLNLAATMNRMGDLPGARDLFEHVLEARERVLPEDHPDVLAARLNLAATIGAMGDLAGERILEERVLASRERMLPEDHPDLLAARLNLGCTLQALGDLRGARELLTRAIEGSERTLPQDHPYLLSARVNLAVTVEELGDLPGARDLERQVVESFERTLPRDHPDLLAARLNLAVTMRNMGDLPGARDLEQQVVEGFERTLPEDHPSLLDARQNLAITMLQMGDLPGSRALFERVLEGRERTLPEDHPDLLGARSGLAASMYEMGDLPGAREQQERVLAAFERTLPEDHPDLLKARMNLTLTVKKMGDLPGARLLQERVLEARERALPEDHPDLLGARMNLAATMYEMGDLPGARLLQERVLAACERTLPEDHPDLLTARTNLANTLMAMGDLPGARGLQERVLADCERTLPEDHPSFLRARQNLAITLKKTGDLPGARDLEQRVVEGRERTLPEDHPDLIQALGNLAVTRKAMGDVSGARSLLPELISGILRRSLPALLLARREARELVEADALCLAKALFASDSPGSDETRVRLFELVETRRLVTSEGARAASLIGADADLASLAREAAEARAKLNDLVAGAARGGPAEALRAELALESERRDKAEREIARALAARGLVAGPITGSALASALSEHGAAAGYLRYERFELDQETGGILGTEDHLLAFVLRPDGSLGRVALGPAAELERLVEAWRDALGGSIGRGSGIGTPDRSEDIELEAGRVLRERLVDPILAAAGEGVTTLFVAPDDLVFLVPLDALPLDGGRLGDRLRIVSEASFGRLIRPAPPLAEEERGLLALGGVDYAAELTTETPVALASPPVEATLRGGEGSSFAPLAATRDEVEALGRLFERAFDAEWVVLIEAGATKAALFERAPNARYLHLATHGWFAPESVKSILDDSKAERSSWQRMSVEETVTGFAPMTLCGLALAGANRGRDSLGRVPGILTAEELSSLDLSSCELAVLSACETNVGIRRAGQGIQSLQSALHAAGARTAITSLWKVDDAATRKLMERFYANLWVEGMPKAEALWEAKCDLRSEGYPVRDWAAWVLSGDPR